MKITVHGDKFREMLLSGNGTFYPLTLKKEHVQILTVMSYVTQVHIGVYAKSLQSCPNLCDPMDCIVH